MVLDPALITVWLDEPHYLSLVKLPSECHYLRLISFHIQDSVLLSWTDVTLTAILGFTNQL